MTKVLITGAAGQIGSELARVHWPQDFELVLTDYLDLDITDSRDVERNGGGIDPDLIINTAGYTAVDRAEDEPEMAFAVNETGVGNLAALADTCGATLIHLSTDYVFDGTKEGWYVEDDIPAPLSVYGASKLAGERRALEARKPIVLRTSWIYGALRPNFVVTMRRLAGRAHHASASSPIRPVARQQPRMSHRRSSTSPMVVQPSWVCSISQLPTMERGGTWRTRHSGTWTSPSRRRSRSSPPPSIRPARSAPRTPGSIRRG